MGLVNELQDSAQEDDVVTVLRKAKRVSAKLGRADISEWLSHEQNGYPDGSNVPDYRRIRVIFCYNTNGWVPAGYGYAKNGIAPLPDLGLNLDMPVGDPINTIADWVKSLNGRDHVYLQLDKDTAAQLRSMFGSNHPEFLDRITFLAQLRDSDLSNIPEQVKNKILDWACELESAGVTGEGQSFSNEEKATAQTVIFNLVGSDVDQLNSSGTNIKKNG